MGGLFDFPLLRAALTVVLSVTITTEVSFHRWPQVLAALKAAHISFTLMCSSPARGGGEQWWCPSM